MRRPDVVGAGIGVAAAVIFVVHGFDGELSRDLGLYAYAGQRVADGAPPYVGVMNRSGPLAHLVPGLGAAGARLAGIDDLVGMRVLFLAMSVACVWAVYLLGRDLYDNRLAGVVAAGLLVCVPGMITYATGGPREKTTMMLLLALALLAATRRRWWWAGAAVALTTLTWQPVLLPALVAVVGAALLAEKGTRLRAVRAIVVGGSLVTAAMIAYFAAVGALREFRDGFVLIHLRYTYQPGLFNDLERQWEGLEKGFGISLDFVVVGLGLLLLLALLEVVVPRRRRVPLSRTRVAFAVAALVGLLWSWRIFNGWADALMLVPFAALGLGGLVALVDDVVPRHVGLVLAAAWILVVGALGLDWSLHEGSRILPKQRQEVDRVFAALAPEATLLSVEAPQPLVLTGRTNPTGQLMFRLGLERYVDATWPGGLAGYAGTVRDEATTLVAVGRGARYPWLMPTLLGDYVPFGTSPGWYWYVRDDVDPATLVALRAAVRG